MFQDHALFDHHDVAGNVAFGLRMQGVGARRRAPRASRRCSTSSAWPGPGAGASTSSPAASSNGSRSPARSRRRRACSCSTSRSRSVDRERRERLARALHDAIRRTAHRDAPRHPRPRRGVHARRRGRDPRPRRRRARSGAATDVWRAPATREVARFLGVATELDRARRARHDRHAVGPAAPRRPTSPDGAGRRRARGPADVVVDPAGRAGRDGRAATWFRRDHFLVELDTAYGPMTAIAAGAAPARHRGGARGPDSTSAVVLPVVTPR